MKDKKMLRAALFMFAVSLLIGVFAYTTNAQALVHFNAVQTDSGVQAVASSTYDSTFDAARTINAETAGHNWHIVDVSGSGWNSGNSERFVQSTLDINLSKLYRLDEIIIYGLTNNAGNTTGQDAPEPDDTTTSVYANPDFDILTSQNGVDYALRAQIRGNNKVITHLTFPLAVGQTVTAKNIRFIFYLANAPQGFARGVEVKALARQ